ncbi:hypothetical protein HZA38_04535 [Candidatus Peregrinibacteria bacterium]|nr:hypothetical protein [Candidatus Peregrinibacteria bacterium]
MNHDDDPFADIETEASADDSGEVVVAPQQDDTAAATPPVATSSSSQTQTQTQGQTQTSSQGGSGFADEIYSKKISAKFRTFFVDLKQSRNGKFVKISEKSRGGQKSTIMLDAEDVAEFVKTLQEIQAQL